MANFVMQMANRQAQQESAINQLAPFVGQVGRQLGAMGPTALAFGGP